jgi:nucleotide-binding universal stress UspA family protein
MRKDLEVSMARIVVGTDGSDNAAPAVRFAAALAAGGGALLEIVYVYDEPATVNPGRIGAPQYHNTEPVEGNAETIVGRAAELAKSVAPDVEVEPSPMAGDVVQVLCDAGADADVLVVGSHARGDFSALVHGSVSYDVLHKAACPVAVVHAAATDGGPVVVGTDGSEEGTAAVRWAAVAAGRSKTFLHIIHAWTVATPVALGPMAVAAPSAVDANALNDAADAVVAKAREAASEAAPGVEITAASSEGVAIEVLEEASKGAAMLVVGAHQRGDLSSLLAGSTSHGLVRGASCPVVCVPA